MASYCCSRFLFAFLAIFHIFLPSFTQKDKKENENLSATVFKFIYDNEQICGDMFANSSWLPAHQNCELKCRMDSEICQMSSEVLIIRRQRCLELPVECRRQLKQLLGGAELYTKPKRREGPIPPRIFKSKIPKSNGGIKGSVKEKEKSSMAIVRDPAAHIPPSPSSPPITSPQSPRQILISLSSRKPLINSPPLPELVPLSLDKEILIPPAQLHTTSPIPLSSTIIFINSPSPISIKNGPIQLPSQTKEQAKQPPHSRMITASPKVGAKKEKVDDSLQIAYQNLYMDSSKATQRIGSSTLQALAVSSPPASTLVPSKSSLQIPQGHTNSFEQGSAELGQPFAGNPFASNPTGVGPTELSVLSAPLFTQLQHLPQPPRPIEEAVKGEEKKNGAGGKDGEKERSYAVFGPPMSRKQLEQGIGKPPQQIQIHPLPAQMAIQPSGYFPQQPFPSAGGAVVQIKQIGDSKQKEQRDEKEGRRPSSLEKKDGRTGGGKHNPVPQQYDGKLMPWWTWRALAENFRNSKKPHFYSTGDAAFLSMDKTVLCCQWALDGLCDRSWQRVRELCPKSCGNVVCSSIDGTLSCNRLVNVDVIACYEQRRTFHRHFFAAPTLEMAQEGGLELVAEGMEQFPRGNAEGEIVVSKTAEQRAFAIEEEIKGLLGVMEGMGIRNSGGEAKEGGFRRRR